MPTYEYRCDACEHQFEVFQSITASALRKCPKCRKLRLRRIIGPGAAVIFKGSGFYQTDYRSESYKKAAEADKSKSTGDGKPSSSSAKPSGEKKSSAGSND